MFVYDKDTVGRLQEIKVVMDGRERVGAGLSLLNVSMFFCCCFWGFFLGYVDKAFSQQPLINQIIPYACA